MDSSYSMCTEFRYGKSRPRLLRHPCGVTIADVSTNIYDIIRLLGLFLTCTAQNAGRYCHSYERMMLIWPPKYVSSLVSSVKAPDGVNMYSFGAPFQPQHTRSAHLKSGKDRPGGRQYLIQLHNMIEKIYTCSTNHPLRLQR